MRGLLPGGGVPSASGQSAAAVLQGVYTRGITKAAEVSQATLFEHFDSKAASFQATMVEPLPDAMRSMRDRAQGHEAARKLNWLAA